MIATDTLLIRATLSSADELGEFAAQVSRALPAELLISTLKLAHEPTTQVVYVYAHLSMATTVEKSVATTIEKAMSMRFPDLKKIRVCRLQKVFGIARHVKHCGITYWPYFGWRFSASIHHHGLSAVYRGGDVSIALAAENGC